MGRGMNSGEPDLKFDGDIWSREFSSPFSFSTVFSL